MGEIFTVWLPYTTPQSHSHLGRPQGHSNNQNRVAIAATVGGTTSKLRRTNGVKNPFSHSIVLHWETQAVVWWQRVFSGEPRAHHWAVTPQKGTQLAISPESRPVWEVSGREWSERWEPERPWTMWESHYSSPALLYLSHKRFEDSTVKPES